MKSSIGRYINISERDWNIVESKCKREIGIVIAPQDEICPVKLPVFVAKAGTAVVVNGKKYWQIRVEAQSTSDLDAVEAKFGQK